MTNVAAQRGLRRADAYFFSVTALLILGMVFLGFAQTYYLAGVFHAKLPSLLVHVHGAIFSIWILLLLLQTALVSVGRVDWHMRLGIIGMILAGLVVVVGFATLIGAVRRHSAPGMSPASLFAVDVLQLSAFAARLLWAFLVRRDGPARKRLMLLGTAALLGPALSRWPYEFVLSSDLAFFGMLDSFLVFLIIFDLWSRRSVHRVTILGSALILVMQFLMAPISHSTWCHTFTAWVENL